MSPISFETFQDQILNELPDHLPGMDLSIRSIDKLQGQSYTGLTVRPENSPVGAMVNLTDIFKDYEAGILSDDQLMDSVISQAKGAVFHMPTVPINELADYNAMKSSLTLQLIPVAGNEDRLATIPHQTIEDTALVYRFELSNTDSGTTSVLVTNDMLDSYGITAEQLHQDALEIAPSNHAASLRNMSDVLAEMSGGLFRPEESPMWVASIEGGMNGAAVIEYPNFLEQAADTLGGDFFVLPSSIHEVILLPDKGELTVEELNEMIRGINEDEVLPEDRLSDNAYHYDAAEHRLELAAAYEDRILNAEETRPETISVLKVEPGKYPVPAEIGSDLESMQEAVGGYIEVVYPFEEEVGVLCNEEGKIEGLPLNRALRDNDGGVYDVIAGNFYVVGLQDEGFRSLTAEEMSTFEERFHQPEAFVKLGKSVMAIPLDEELRTPPDSHDMAEPVHDAR